MAIGCNFSSRDTLHPFVQRITRIIAWWVLITNKLLSTAAQILLVAPRRSVGASTGAVVVVSRAYSPLAGTSRHPMKYVATYHPGWSSNSSRRCLSNGKSSDYQRLRHSRGCRRGCPVRSDICIKGLVTSEASLHIRTCEFSPLLVTV